MGMGLVGAGGVAGAQDALQQLLAQRMQQEAIKRQMAQQEFENAMQTRTMDENAKFREQQMAAQGEQQNFTRAGALASELSPNASIDPQTAGMLRTGGRGALVRENAPNAAQGFLMAAPDYVPGQQPGSVFTGTAGQLNTLSDNDRARQQDEANAAYRDQMLGLQRDQLAETRRSNMAGEANARLKAMPDTPQGPSAYAIDTAKRTITSVDDVLKRIGASTAGPLGSIMRNIPGTEAANVSADLSSVAANVAFQALQAMREASKTGGALGQISERELDLLSAVEGSIRQNQSPDNLKRNLLKIKESQQRWLAGAMSLGGDRGALTLGEAPAGAPGGVRKYNPQTGKIE